jgi:hypothetical protein
VIFLGDQHIVNVGNDVGEVITIFINLWKNPSTPNRPMGDVFFLNWPSLGREKAVYLRHSGLNIICQNSEVKSVIEKIDRFELQTYNLSTIV